MKIPATALLFEIEPDNLNSFVRFLIPIPLPDSQGIAVGRFDFQTESPKSRRWAAASGPGRFRAKVTTKTFVRGFVRWSSVFR